jgi:secreted trypsin-like serine protease
LANAIIFNDNVKAAVLPEPALKPVAGTNLIVSGWGKLIDGFSSPTSILQVVTVPVVTQTTCNSVYGSITDSMICAGEAYKDSCQGDSGGPLVLKQGVTNVIVGVVSFGIGCGKPGYPGVYARVTTFLDWIRENMVNV